MKKPLKVPGLWIQDSYGAVKIDHGRIAYCRHSDGYTTIVFSDGQQRGVRVPLKRMEDKLPDMKFYRCHRNYLINLDYVRNFSGDKNNLIFPGRHAVPVSRRRREDLLMRVTGQTAAKG